MIRRYPVAWCRGKRDGQMWITQRPLGVSVHNSAVDFICIHPPYADIIKYSEDIEENLSYFKVKDYLDEIKKVVAESCHVLRKDKFCAVLMGDTRQKGCMIPMSFDVIKFSKMQDLLLKN